MGRLGGSLAIASICALALAGCEREDRDYRPDPVSTGTEEHITMSALTAGPEAPVAAVTGLGQKYEANAFHVAQGKKYYVWFNCNGCHANGGGDSGPPLMDDRWIYGGSIENIVQTIREGRPNGMPSFRGKITDEQIWQLASYVRSMSGNLWKDVAPGRNDDLNPHPSENRMPKQEPVSGGTTPPATQMPQ
jgi:cytochrome c oxidase cbb3-type subunit 3